MSDFRKLLENAVKIKDDYQNSKSNAMEYKRLNGIVKKQINPNTFTPSVYNKIYAKIAKNTKTEAYVSEMIMNAILNSDDPIVIDMVTDIFAHVVLTDTELVKNLENIKISARKKYEESTELQRKAKLELEKYQVAPQICIDEISECWIRLTDELEKAVKSCEIVDDLPVEMKYVLVILCSGGSRFFSYTSKTLIHNFDEMKRFNLSHISDLIRKINLVKKYIEEQDETSKMTLCGWSSNIPAKLSAFKLIP